LNVIWLHTAMIMLITINRWSRVWIIQKGFHCQKMEYCLFSRERIGVIQICNIRIEMTWKKFQFYKLIHFSDIVFCKTFHQASIFFASVYQIWMGIEQWILIIISQNWLVPIISAAFEKINVCFYLRVRSQLENIQLEYEWFQ